MDNNDKPIAPKSSSVNQADFISFGTDNLDDNLSPFIEQLIHFFPPSPDIKDDPRNYQEFANCNEFDQVSSESQDNYQKRVRKFHEANSREKEIRTKINRGQKQNVQHLMQKAQKDVWRDKNPDNYDEICDKVEIPLNVDQINFDYNELANKIDQNLETIKENLIEYTSSQSNKAEYTLSQSNKAKSGSFYSSQTGFDKQIAGLLNNIFSFNFNYDMQSIEPVSKNRLKRSLLIQCYKVNKFKVQPREYLLRKRVCSFQFKNPIQRRQILFPLVTKTRVKPIFFDIKRVSEYFDVKAGYSQPNPAEHYKNMIAWQNTVVFPLDHRQGINNCLKIQDYQKLIRENQERAKEYDQIREIMKLSDEFDENVSSKTKSQKFQENQITINFDRIVCFKQYTKNTNPIFISSISQNYETLLVEKEVQRKFKIEQLQGKKIEIYKDIEAAPIYYSINDSCISEDDLKQPEEKDSHSLEGGSDLT